MYKTTFGEIHTFCEIKNEIPLRMRNGDVTIYQILMILVRDVNSLFEFFFS